MIDPLVAVELFGIEEMKPELLAAHARRWAQGPRPHAAGSRSFGASISRLHPATTDSIQMDVFFAAGEADKF